MSLVAGNLAYPAEPALAERREPVRLLDSGSVSPISQCRLGFILFILVNAVLFVRPAEIIHGIDGWPIYEVVIVACLLGSLPVVLPQLAWGSLRRNPITLCVIGLMPAIALSHLSHGNFYDARLGTIEFLKIVIYYLLLVGLIDSAARLRLFLLIIALFIVCTAIVALLNHHGVIEVPGLTETRDEYGEDELGQPILIYRLCAMGIFGDPNDLALILNFALFIFAFWLFEAKRWLVRLALLAPIATLLHALVLTQSRGGFLSLLAGIIVLVFTRVRLKRAILITAVALPAILMAFSGRITNFDITNSQDTAQGRIQLWSESLVLFHQWPLFGIGQGNLADELGHVAHNSYVHGYAELGIFGGTLFVGALYLGMVAISRLRARKSTEGCAAQRNSDELLALRQCLLPAVAAYLVGLYSLSRTYGNATYLVVGLAAAFLALRAARETDTAKLSFRLVRNVGLVSIGCVAYFELFVRLFAQ